MNGLTRNVSDSRFQRATAVQLPESIQQLALMPALRVWFSEDPITPFGSSITTLKDNKKEAITRAQADFLHVDLRRDIRAILRERLGDTNSFRSTGSVRHADFD